MAGNAWDKVKEGFSDTAENLPVVRAMHTLRPTYEDDKKALSPSADAAGGIILSVIETEAGGENEEEQYKRWTKNRTVFPPPPDAVRGQRAVEASEWKKNKALEMAEIVDSYTYRSLEAGGLAHAAKYYWNRAVAYAYSFASGKGAEAVDYYMAKHAAEKVQSSLENNGLELGYVSELVKNHAAKPAAQEAYTALLGNLASPTDPALLPSCMKDEGAKDTQRASDKPERNITVSDTTIKVEPKTIETAKNNSITPDSSPSQPNGTLPGSSSPTPPANQTAKTDIITLMPGGM